MLLRRLTSLACEPVDAASLAVFRIGIGVIVLAEIGRFFLHGWIRDHYLTPPFLFKYYGFEWVVPLPGNGLFWLFGVMGLLALMVTLGLYYRIAAIGLFFAFSYVFLLDQGNYLNQYYLLLSVLMLFSFLPADREYSISARRQRNSVAPVTPRWSVWVLRLQFEVMLIYAGLVKINADWLAGQPLGLWFAERADHLPVVGSVLTTSGVSIGAAYAVVLLHVVGAPLLMLRRTRFVVFVLYVCFHLGNSILFHIGLFPWITLLGTLMFFDPDWPRQVAQRITSRDEQTVSSKEKSSPVFDLKITTSVFLAVFFIFQILFPLRYLLYPGNVSWTNEGHWFSWRMKLHDKRGDARFIVTDNVTGQRWEVDPGDCLRPRQIQLMAVTPDMILQFAHYLERDWKQREGISDVRINAVVMCSLNGRPPAPLVDHRQDLTHKSRSLGHYNWILPLNIPLNPPDMPAHLSYRGIGG